MRPTGRSMAHLNKVKRTGVYDVKLNDPTTLKPANSKMLTNGETSLLVHVDDELGTINSKPNTW